MSSPTPILTDAAALRERIRAKAIGAIQQALPLQMRNGTLEVSDLRVDAKHFSPVDQYNALMKDGTLQEAVKATLTFKDTSGKVIDTAKNFTLVHLPYLTERHTVIAGGNEYQVANQLRRKPGIYTARADNGELRAIFNTGRGANFNLGFEPDKGTFHLQHGTSNIPLYPVLRGLGVSHAEIAAHLGDGVAAENARYHGKDPEKATAKLYAKLEHPSVMDPKLPHEQKVQAIRKRWEIAALDPHVTTATLGKGFDRVTHEALLTAAKKVLDVHAGKRQVDDTDALTYKTFHAIDDFLAERIRLTARDWAPKARYALSTKSQIREALRPAPFSDSVRKWVTTSSLTAVPTGINPLELIDHAVKVTSLGEGGIPSERAIPLDARMIHNTHFGALDPIRTPECAGPDTEVLVERGWVFWPDVRDDDKFFTQVDGRRGFRTAERITRAPYAGLLCGFTGEAIDCLVTPNHRVYGAPTENAYNDFVEAWELQGATQWHFPTESSTHTNTSTRVYEPELHTYVKPYRGTVYCATVPGGLLYMRRNGCTPYWTGNSNHSGVDIRATLAAHRDDHGNLYTVARNLKTGKDDFLKAGDLAHYVVAFPGQAVKGQVDAFVNGQVQKVDASRVTHQISHTGHLYSPATSLIPMIHGIQGNRAIMGSKMGTQALPLVEREAPFVQVRSHLPNEVSYEALYGHMVAPRAPVSGKVVKIEDGWIHIRPDGAEKKAGTYAVSEKVADRPVVTRRKFGPFTFAIEIKKGERPFGKAFLHDYGYLPGYVGPDGDSLDFWVGDAADGALASVATEEKKGGAWRRADKKYIVGVPKGGIAAVLAQIEQKPDTRCVDRVDYASWDELKESIERYADEDEGAEKTASKDEGVVKVPYNQNFPFPAKTYLHHDLSVKPGDVVKAGQRLGDSNYTRAGVLALGKNLLVAYMPYHGLNSNDAVVISEGCSKKLTSEHMYREVYQLPPGVELSKERHKFYYGTKYSLGQYAVLDEHGVVKKGATVHPKDLLVVGLVKTPVVGTDALLGRISKALAKPYQESTLVWDHGVPGEVVDVVRTGTQIAILVRTREQMQVGDKLAGRYGNKGVVAKIVPDHEMIQDAKGRPIDLLLTSAGVVSRTNPSQIIETAVGKVVEKTGKPILFDNNAPHNLERWASDLLKKHGVEDKEHVYDPLLKRKIVGPDGQGVLVGRQFIYKLFKSTDTNFAGHGVGPYDLNEQPLKTGGDDSAKGLGKMEFDALVAHNARNFLREAATIKGQKNDEFWKAVQLGTPLPQSKSPFAFRKFVGMLEGAGLKVDQRGSKFKLLPLTDRDVEARTRGAITKPETLIAKNLKPEPGGLFDPRLTGGPQGTLYAHIDLHEPIPHPVFKEPVRRLLGLTEKAFDAHLAEHGGTWFRDQLKAIDVPARIKELRARMVTAKGADLNDVVKQIKYLEALQKEGYKPHEAYVVSKVPVIPPVFRPIIPQPNDPSQLMVADANKLYAHVLDSTHTLKTTAVESDVGKHRQQVFNAVAALYGTEDVANEELKGQSVKGFLSNIAGVGTPKGGFFQRKLMRRTQDVSGRGTAVPDPTLNMDEVGIPEPMLWGMYDKLITARLIRQGYTAIEAKERVLKKDHVAREALLAETRERPVLINRAPTLHRWSIVAAKPVIVQGKTIRVNPFVEKGLNLDYDGDLAFSMILMKVSPEHFSLVHNQGSWHLRELGGAMAARLREFIGVKDGDRLYLTHLADFPHLPEHTTKEHIDFHPVPEGIEVFAYEETTGRIEPRPASHWSFHRQREIELVRLTSGREIVTDDDPRAVYGLDANLNYCRARPKDAVGMFVPYAVRFDNFESGITEVETPNVVAHDRHKGRLRSRVELNRKTGRVLGALCGDGWVVSRGESLIGVALASLDDAHANRYIEELKEFFVQPPTISRASRADGVAVGYGASERYAVNSGDFAAFILPLIGKLAKNKHLPPFFLMASREFRIGLLAGLLDTDGSIAVSNGKKNPQWMVNFTSVSLRLCQEVTWLAKSLGVTAAISTTKTPACGPCWQVTFSTPELHKLGEMPCAHAVKARRFADFFAGPAPRSDLGGHTRNDTIPFPVAVYGHVRPLYPLEVKKLSAKKAPAVGAEAERIKANASMAQLLWRARRDGYLSRHSATRCLQEHPELRTNPDELLQRWIRIVDNTSVRWDRVVSFERTGIKEDGYDLTVPGYETFMNVEGVILSNTLQVHAPITLGAIEEAKRLTLSQMLLADHTKNKILAFPQHEAIIGFTHAAKLAPSSKPVRKFKDADAAFAAYKRGEISLNDPVELG